MQRAQRGLIPFARLVADDRVHLEAQHGRLLVRPAEALAGLIEVRGLGIRRLAYEPVAVVGLVVDLAAADAERLPAAADQEADIAGVAPAAACGRSRRRGAAAVWRCCDRPA